MHIDAPVWLWAVGLFLVLFGTALAYFRNQRLRDLSPSLRRILIALRFVSLSLLLLLMLDPNLVQKSSEEKPPVLGLAVDVSRSMAMHPQVDTIALRAQLDDLTDKLSQVYELRTFSFGTDFSSGQNPFNAKGTDLSEALKGLGRDLGEEPSRAIVISDGRWNQGDEPRAAPELELHLIAFGTPENRRDVWISRLSSNPKVQTGNRFEIRAEFRALGYRGRSFNIELRRGNQVLERRVWVPESDDRLLETRFYPEAGAPGFEAYTVEIQGDVEGESTANNRSGLTVEVVDQKADIILIYSGVHPDIGAVVRAVEQGGGHKVALVPEKNLKPGLKADVFVLWDPSLRSLSTYQALLERHRGGVWVFASSPGSLSTLSQIQNQLQFASNRASVERVLPGFDPGFSRFRIDFKALGEVPEIEVPFGRWTSGADLALAARQISSGGLTDKPLMAAFRDSERRPWSIWIGRGYWQWPVSLSEKQKNTEAFAVFCSEWVRYLLSAPDQDRLKLDYLSSIDLFDDWTLRALLFDQTGRATTQAELDLELTRPDGSRSDFGISASGESFQWGFTPEQAGDYSFRLRAVFDGSTLERSGVFKVGDRPRESIETGSDTALLGSLARTSGGSLSLFSTVQEDPDAWLRRFLDEVPPGRLIERSQSKSLIDWKILLALLLLVWIAEWGLRRWSGVY